MSASQILLSKRLKGELKNLNKNRESYYQVVQDTDDKLLFYFLLRGTDKDYKGGYYIGKIRLPNDYPTNPGDFYMLTPSGRFEINSKICLTNSSYHKESWSPSWNIEKMVIGFVSVFLEDNTTGISHIKRTPEERRKLANNSMEYNLKYHKNICMLFDQFFKSDGILRNDKEIEEYVNNLKLKKKKNKLDIKNNKTIKVIKKNDFKNNNTLDKLKDDVKVIKNDDTKVLNTNSIKVKKKEVNLESDIPRTYQEWYNMVDNLTIENYNSHLLSMNF